MARDEGAAVDLDRPLDLVRLASRKAAAAWSQRSSSAAAAHPAQPGQDADEPVREVDLAELRHLLAELALALLRPDREEGIELERPEPLDDRLGRRLDDAPQPGPIDRHERVAEVEGDRPDGREVHRRQVATLDGQISRNGQYEQDMRSGFAV